MRRLQDPSEQGTSETVIVRAPQDASSTAILSAEMIEFGKDDDDDDEDE
jgi:hypothetical protein